jgi:hypothetical protein
VDISINKQLQLISQDDFNFLVKNGKRSSILLNFDFESLIYCKWGFVKETLPELFLKNDFETLFFLILKDRGHNYFISDIQNIAIDKAISFILWIIDEIKIINELESKYLTSDPDIKMIQSGINNLNKFGYLNMIDNLAKGDILKYDLIKNIAYNVIFDKQYFDITKSQIEKKLSKIK